MELEPKTPEEIQQIIKAARDSIWVIEDSIARLDAGDQHTNEIKNTIDRNVNHLKIIVADQEIANSEHDISDLYAAILLGESKLEENI